MTRLTCILGVCAVVSFLPRLNAAILAGASGAGPMTFSTHPIVTGGSVSSLNAGTPINPDLLPPTLLAAHLSNLGSHFFELIVDEPLCLDLVACGATALCPFNWAIVPVTSGVEGGDLRVDEVISNGTNLTLRTTAPWVAGTRYRIKIRGDCDGGINDLFGNQLRAGEPGSTIDVPFPLPQMKIAASGTNVVVSWPADSGWVLQRANAPVGPYTTVSPDNGSGVYTNVTPGNSTNLFFRLQYLPEPLQ